MIRVTLKQFRCWENLNITINLGQITLLKGNSGSGKTTILQALLWCLYGKIQLVTPNQLNDEKKSKQAKTQVTIEMPFMLNDVFGQLIISRKKNPNQFILSHNNSTYEDKVAQAMIDDLFGTYDIWLASCYIGQNSRNTFLTAPNSGKMELLNSIAFHEEDPAIFIDKIVSVITEKEAQYKLKLADFTTNIETLKTLLAANSIDKSLSNEQIEVKKQEIVTLQEAIKTLQIIKNQRDLDMVILNNLQDQYQKIPLIIIPEPDDNLSIMMKKYGEVEHLIPQLYRRDDLNNQLQALPIIEVEHTFTLADYHECTILESTIQINQQLATGLGIPYDSEKINEVINKYQTALDIQNIQVLRNKITFLEQEYEKEKVPVEIPILIPQTIPLPDYAKFDFKAFSTIVSQKSAELATLLKETVAAPTKELEQKVANLYQQMLEKVDYQCDQALITTLQNQLVIVAEQKLGVTDHSAYEQQISALTERLTKVEQTAARDLINNIAVPDFTVYDKQPYQEQLQKLIAEQNELKAHIQYLQLGQDVLACPKCNSPLRYHQCTLISAECNPATSTELINANNKFVEYSNSINQIGKYIEALGVEEQTARRNYENELQKGKQEQITKLNNEIMTLTKEMQMIRLNEQRVFEQQKQEQLLKINNEIQSIKMEEQKQIALLKQARDNKINAEIAELNAEIKHLITITNNEKQVKIDSLNTAINQANMSIQQMQNNQRIERMKYESNVREEDIRVSNLKRLIAQMEEEQRRRNVAVISLEQQLLERRTELEALLKTCTFDPNNLQQQLLTNIEVEQIIAYLNRVKEVRVLAVPPHSSTYIKQCLTAQDIKQKRLDLTETLQKHLAQIPLFLHDEAVTIINSYVENLKKYLAIKNELTNKKLQLDIHQESLAKQIAQLQIKIGPTDPAIQIEQNNQRIMQLKQEIDEGERANETIAYHGKMERDRDVLTLFSQEITELQMLKQYAIDTESKSLQDVVASINTSISEVCETLFDKDINIVLNLFKTTKSTKVVKPQINFTISYKGGLFDNINQMSGGEGDRASIALTLALNRLSSFPILMLDESLSSLDMDMKEATVDTISKTVVFDQHKQQKINRAVVIIMHDGIEGIFDNIINIDDISEGRY